MTPDDNATPEKRRALVLVRGTPTDEELAALTVGLLAAAVRPDAPAPPERSAWSDPAARVRRPLPVGPGAWRASARPH